MLHASKMMLSYTTGAKEERRHAEYKIEYDRIDSGFAKQPRMVEDPHRNTQ
jgi:hypothetical protein